MVLANTAGNPLSAGSLSVFMATSLPKDASPQIKTPFDAIALAIHAGMIAVGFKLVGLGEEHRIKVPEETESEAYDPRPLPIEWNVTPNYAFCYSHPQSSMEYLIKLTRLGGKAIVFGMGIGDDKTAQFEAVTRDYISDSSLPATPVSPDADMEAATKFIREQIFVTVGRLNDLGSLLKVSIIQKLAPSISKEGYEEERQAAERQSHANNNGDRRPNHPRNDRDPPPARPYPYNDPLAIPRRNQPNRPLPEPMPGFEDELEINRPLRRPGGGRNPLNIGEDDLYPPGLGPRDPLRPSFGPGATPGGMHPTFDDPLFGGEGRGPGGFDPQAPPGARYDPIGPGGAPRDRGLGGPRFPGGGGGRGGPPNPFGGYGGDDFI